MNSTWLITSELANQRARKVLLFTNALINIKPEGAGGGGVRANHGNLTFFITFSPGSRAASLDEKYVCTYFWQNRNVLTSFSYLA